MLRAASVIIALCGFVGGISAIPAIPVKDFSGATFGHHLVEQQWNFTADGDGSLDKDGFRVLHLGSAMGLERTALVQQLRDGVLAQLPTKYVNVEEQTKFVHGVVARQFHRDVGQYSIKTQHPVFKALTYFNAGPLLSVVAGSHSGPTFTAEHAYTISGPAGTTVINNADVVHAGAVNTLGAKRQLVGLTFCHAADAERVRAAQRVRASLEPNKPNVPAADANLRGWVEGGSVQTLQW
eukprot:g3901.t1